MSRVTGHFDRLEDIPDDAVAVDDERRPLGVARGFREHPEGRAQAAVGIRQERRRDARVAREVSVRFDGIPRQPDEFGVEGGEVSGPLTEVDRFACSAGRRILRISPEHDQLRTAEICQIERPVLGLPLDLRQPLSYLYHRLSLAAKNRSSVPHRHERSYPKDLVADGEGLGLSLDRRELGEQAALADVRLPDVHLALVQRVRALGERRGPKGF